MPNIRPLSAELAKKAATELNEDPEQIDDYLTIIRQWIKKQPHLTCQTDDQFLVVFLRGCKYSLERTKEKIDMFYSVRNLLPEVFENRFPIDEKTRTLLRMGVQLPLPNTEHPDSPRIMLVRFGAYKADEYDIQEVMKAGVLINDLLIQEDDSLVVAGQIGIMDMKNVTMSHFIQFNLAFMKKITLLSQDASPLRQKGFHYLNMPVAFETIYNLFKTLLNEKMRNRLMVHSSMESLYKHVPQRLLPKEYGGEAGTIEEISNQLIKRIDAREELFKEEAKYRCDEKKRIGEPKISESLYGVEGSFRKLNVD